MITDPSKTLWPQIKEMYGDVYNSANLDYTNLFGPIAPPTRWQRIKYQLKRPFWWMRDALCKALGCDHD